LRPPLLETILARNNGPRASVIEADFEIIKTYRSGLLKDASQIGLKRENTSLYLDGKNTGMERKCDEWKANKWRKNGIETKKNEEKKPYWIYTV
jgi:hypothetical protein